MAHPDDDKLRIAFITACMKGRKADVDKLIADGANVNDRDQNGATPLFYAISGNNLETVTDLLAHDVNVNAAIKQGFISEWDTFQTGATPLTLAAQRNATAIAELLLEKGADVKAADAYGLTALHYAAKRGNMKLLARLLDKGADINAKDKGGHTAEFFARENGYKEAADFLNEKANPHAPPVQPPAAPPPASAFPPPSQPPQEPPHPRKPPRHIKF